MRNLIVAVGLALAALATPTQAQLSFGFSSGGVSIGINVPTYPRLVRVPGYPVYYAPGVNSNYFFYDGLYWVFEDGEWYESDWYNGPWTLVPPDVVPLYVLRVPVRYYHRPPPFFRGWALNAPPRWNEHWGREWSDRHRDWNRWDRGRAPAPAPLPSYQGRYSGDRYPHGDDRIRERDRNYRYQPRDNVAREHFQQRPQVEQRREDRRGERPQARGERPAPEVRERSQPPGVMGPGQPAQSRREQEDRDRRRGSGPGDSGGG